MRLSLPVPRGRCGHYSLAGNPTQHEAVGFREDHDGGSSIRRAILLGTAPGAPEQLTVRGGDCPSGPFTGPEAELRVVEQRSDIALVYEIDELVLRMADRWIGIRIGLLTDEGLHWWQWVRLETIAEGPICRSYRAMGAAPVHFETDADIPEPRQYARYPWLHRHNHVRCEAFARCYANGVIELSLRHINGRFFTEGGDVEGVVPVFAFRAQDLGPWSEGQTTEVPLRWQMGEVVLDTGDAAHLANEERPAKAWREDDLIIYQPYEGMEALAGENRAERKGDPYLVRAGDRLIPKGMARTVRLTASLGDAPPEVAVYLAPDWWYGLCEEFGAEPLLPVRDECDEVIRTAEEWLNTNLYQDCFDDGAQCRTKIKRDDGGPGDTGWEGETPFAHLLAAYRSGSSRTYDLAIRSCYHVADVATDHALFAVRMHAYESDAQSLPMARIMGHFGGYLETGDPYLSEIAMAVIETAYWWDRSYWPRRSIGRDAVYIRGLIFLYRYTGERFYLKRAREAIGRVMAVQHPDGSYADQGGTTGVHGGVNLVVKPWMGCMATEPMIDYLEHVEDEEVAAAALRFADWLLASRVEQDGDKYFTYQVGFGDQTHYQNIHGAAWELPSKNRWHLEYLARVLGWASLRSGKPDYYQAWLESFIGGGGRVEGDFVSGKILQNLTWLRAKLWSPRWIDNRVELSPRPDLTGSASEARISTPEGEIGVSSDD